MRKVKKRREICDNPDEIIMALIEYWRKRKDESKRRFFSTMKRTYLVTKWM